MERRAFWVQCLGASMRIRDLESILSLTPHENPEFILLSGLQSPETMKTELELFKSLPCSFVGLENWSCRNMEFQRFRF